jgi:Domain of unknown function (DUF3854)
MQQAVGGSTAQLTTTKDDDSWLSHVRQSGLTEATIRAAGIQALPANRLPPYAKSATNSYVIPYFDLRGRPLKDFYRIRWLPAVEDVNGRLIRYNQPPESGTHLYLPPPPIVDPKRWNKPDASGKYEPLWITEGEKKALKGAQEGFLCCGIGGVNSWRRNTAKVPKDKAKESKDGKYLIIPVGRDAGDDLKGLEDTAPELAELPLAGRVVYIVFDSDPTLNGDVQDAAFELAMWLFEKDAIPYQVELPRISYQKIGLDDFLCLEGAQGLRRLASQSAKFPVHSQPHMWIKKTLDKDPKRPGIRKVARAVIADLDRRGSRFYDDAQTFYYFQNETKQLHDFPLGASDVRQMRLTSFGNILINNYGVLSNDGAALNAIADTFAQFDPIRPIQPKSVVFAHYDAQSKQDVLYYQMSDSRIARVTADSITFVDNGHDGILFKSGVTAPVDEEAVIDYLASHGRPQDLWTKALGEFNIQPLGGFSLEETRMFLSALFYMAPWLNRWRNLKLPFELAIAEPNSGKTVLYNLRMGVLTGDTNLDNVPTDMRSWYAQLASAPAIWVCDNLGDIKRELREDLSDELARIITADRPTARTRKLYTTMDVQDIPINCTFAATAIRNPFWKPDILQRAVIYSMHAIPAGERDSDWCAEHMNRRGDWVGEHLLAIQAFFGLVRKHWRPHYRSGHRLTHFEQAARLMIAALGHQDEANVIASKIQDVVQNAIADYDPTMDALRTFAKEWFDMTGRAVASFGEIVDWVQEDTEGRFIRLKTLKSTVALSRYFAAHEYDVANSAGLVIVQVANRAHVTLKSNVNQTNGVATTTSITSITTTTAH